MRLLEPYDGSLSNFYSPWSEGIFLINTPRGATIYAVDRAVAVTSNLNRGSIMLTGLFRSQ